VKSKIKDFKDRNNFDVKSKIKDFKDRNNFDVKSKIKDFKDRNNFDVKKFTTKDRNNFDVKSKIKDFKDRNNFDVKKFTTKDRNNFDVKSKIKDLKDRNNFDVKKVQTRDFLNLDDLDFKDIKSLIEKSKFYKKFIEDEDKDKKISKDEKEEEKSSKNGDYYKSINYTEPYTGFNFAAVGDFGCNSNTKSTIKNIEGKDIDLLLALGDFSYTTDSACWLDTINPLKEKTKVIVGNHDTEPPNLLNQYVTSFNLSKQYYSFDYKNIHFLILSSEIFHKQGSEQYNFVINDLKKASTNPDIDWIIVSQHTPAYTSLSSVSADSSMRDTYHDLMDQYGVDLVLQGHLHNYQRTYPLTYNPNAPVNPLVSDVNKNTYFNPNGPIFLIVGTGGVNTHSLKNQEPYVVYQQNSDFGFLNVNLNANGTNLEGKFYSNSGVVLDRFSISKEVGKAEENKPPTAEDDHYSTFANEKITIRTAIDNDIDPNPNDALFISSIQSITDNQGLAVLNTNKKLITYYPHENFTGVDSFNYTISDENLSSDTGTINIEVKDKISSEDILYNKTNLDKNNCNLGNIFEGVKDPQRFKIHSECEEVKGQVYHVKSMNDGNYRFTMALDQNYTHLLQKGNQTETEGLVVVEILSKDKNSTNITLPKPGDKIQLWGAWVEDATKGWSEIHPAWMVAIRPQ